MQISGNIALMLPIPVALLEDTSLPKAEIFLADTFEITDCEFERQACKQKRRKPNGHDVFRKPKQKELLADNETDGEDSPTVTEDLELRHNPPLEWAGLKNLDSTSEELANLDVPYKAFSISWREPSKELDQVIAKLAEDVPASFPGNDSFIRKCAQLPTIECPVDLPAWDE